MGKKRKRRSRKETEKIIWSDSNWTVCPGRLVPARGRPPGKSQLFKYVAEKLPFGSLGKVAGFFGKAAKKLQGVYLAHDSIGVARYGGRGGIFHRLRSHRRKYPKELVYFSFYVVENKSHEREIENLILRAAGHQMILNQRKVRANIEAGRIKDYEAGTFFFERQRKRGKRKRAKVGS